MEPGAPLWGGLELACRKGGIQLVCGHTNTTLRPLDRISMPWSPGFFFLSSGGVWRDMGAVTFRLRWRHARGVTLLPRIAGI